MKRKSIAIIGLGRFGSTLAKTVVALGHEVLGIDKDKTIVQKNGSLYNTRHHCRL